MEMKPMKRTNKTMYELTIISAPLGFVIYDGDEIIGSVDSQTELNLWLEDHATLRGLCADDYLLIFDPKPLKSNEIIERTQQICGRVQEFDKLQPDIKAIHTFSKWVVDLRKWKKELDEMPYSAENFNAIANCKILVDWTVEFGESLIGYTSKKYIL